MKTVTEEKLKIKLEKRVKRALKPEELANIKSDALNLAQYCLSVIEDLEDEIKDLTKRINKLENK